MKKLQFLNLKKLLMVIFITICFSNCTVFGYAYVQVKVWLLIGALLLIVIYKSGSAILKTPQQIYLLVCASVLISFMLSPYKEKSLPLTLIILEMVLISGIRFSEDQYLFFVNGCKYISLFIAVTIIIELFNNSFNVDYLWFLGTPYRRNIEALRLQKSSEILFYAYSGVAFEKADAAYYLAIGLSALAAKFKQDRGLSKMELLEGGILLFAMVLTGKRMMILCIAVVFLANFSLTTQNNKLMKFIGVLIVGIMVLIILANTVPAFGKLFDRFLSAFSGEDAALEERYEKWHYAIELFFRRPVFGYGYGSYNEAAKLIGYQAVFFVHNIYIQLLADTGIFGLLSFLIFAGYNLIRSWVCLKRDSVYNISKPDLLLTFSFSMQLIILVYGLSGNTIFYRFQLFMYVFSTIIANSCISSIKRNRDLNHGEEVLV